MGGSCSSSGFGEAAHNLEKRCSRRSKRNSSSTSSTSSSSSFTVKRTESSPVAQPTRKPLSSTSTNASPAELASGAAKLPKSEAKSAVASVAVGASKGEPQQSGSQIEATTNRSQRDVVVARKEEEEEESTTTTTTTSKDNDQGVQRKMRLEKLKGK